MDSHANPYGFTTANVNSLHLDITQPQSDYSPFFDDFALLPSPQPDDSFDDPSGTFSPTSPSTTISPTATQSQNLSTSQTPREQSFEEDKRRRNTEASARFRVKKKEKEQQLEKTAKEMSERVGDLEERCRQLERENGWLRGLIVERRENGRKEGRRRGKVRFDCEERGGEKESGES